MPRVSLEDLYRRFVKESETVMAAFKARLIEESCVPPHRMGREMCVVRLHDAWERTCKELIIASACEEPVTALGQTVSRVVPSRQQVLPQLRATFTGITRKQRYWEPAWGDPRSLLDTAQRLGLSNYPTLSLAMGVPTKAASHLKDVRHFFAHRAGNTAANVARVALFYRLSAKSTADDVIGSTIPPGLTIFESWIHDLRTMLRAAVA